MFCDKGCIINKEFCLLKSSVRNIHYKTARTFPLFSSCVECSQARCSKDPHIPPFSYKISPKNGFETFGRRYYICEHRCTKLRLKSISEIKFRNAFWKLMWQNDMLLYFISISNINHLDFEARMFYVFKDLKK